MQPHAPSLQQVQGDVQPGSLADSPLIGLLEIQVKVWRLYLPNEGSLADCEPPVRFEPRTHRLRGWTADFPSQVPRCLLDVQS